MVEEKKKTEDKVELIEVPTQVGPAVRLPDGKVLGMEEYLVWLGNLIYEIRKNV